MVLEKIHRFERWQEGNTAGPLGLYLTLTERCNLTCVFCRYRNWEEYKREDSMPDKEWIRLIRESAKLGLHWVDIFGGEPLLRKNLFLKLLKVTKEYGIEGSMVTNGMLLTGELARKIVQANWNLVQVSMDAPVSEIHNQLRENKESFARATAAIGHLVREKKENKTSLPHIQINMVLTNSNMHLLSDMITFAHERGCQGVKFMPMVLSEIGAKGLQIQPHSFPFLSEEIKVAKKIADASGISTNLSDLKQSLTSSGPSHKNWNTIKHGLLNEHEGYPLCFSPWWALRIFPEGWATCCVSSHRKLVNVRSHSLEEIWKCSAFEDIRKQLLHTTIRECEQCCYVVASDNLAVIAAITKE